MSKNNASIWGIGNPVEKGSYLLKPPRPIESFVVEKGNHLSAPAQRTAKQVTVTEINLNGGVTCKVIFKNRCGRNFIGTLQWK